jgi:hypothetical protein
MLSLGASDGNKNMNRIQLNGALILASLFSWHAGAHAAEPGFYIGAAAGAVGHDFDRSRGMLISIDSPFGGGVFTAFPETVEVEEDDFAWSATLGYRINTYLAAELTYTGFGDTKVLETYRFDNLDIPFFPNELTRNLTTSVSGPSLSVLGFLPIGSRFELFARAGVLFADAEVELLFTSGSTSETFGSEVRLGGVGLNWSMTEKWNLRLEQQRTGTIDANIYTGESDLDQTSLAVIFRL